jgi:catechol 2,3-dioxygenase-like lactoylglutathione lyase family enzyme
MAEYPTKSGIPTALGVDHIAVTVPDLAQALEFFSTVLGWEEVYSIGPVSDPSGDWMAVHLDVEPRASLNMAMMRAGPTQNVELFEYRAADQVTRPPRNSDIGGHHIAIYVEDMLRAIDYLNKVPGVRVLGTPTPMTEGPNAGQTICYFTTPWGMYMELISYQGGMRYLSQTDKRLFDPSLRRLGQA